MTQAISSTRTQCAATWALSGRALRAMLPTLALVGLFWSVSSWGYYALVNAMALDSGYDDAPLLFASYYLAWSAIVLLTFRPVFEGSVVPPRSFRSRDGTCADSSCLRPLRRPGSPPPAGCVGLSCSAESARIHVRQCLVLSAQIGRNSVSAGSRRGHGAAGAARTHAAWGDLDPDGRSLWRLPPHALARRLLAVLRGQVYDRRCDLRCRDPMALLAHTPWIPLGLRTALGLLRAGRSGHASCSRGAQMGDVMESNT